MSVTDGEPLPDGFGKERKRSSRAVILAVIIVAVLVIGAVAWLTVQVVNNGEHPLAGHTAHKPISINGNRGFTHANGVVSGSGTASNPYIIANWDINASTANGIRVQGTNAHFIIRNCDVHGSSTFGIYGIYLSNCVNGTLENDHCANNSNGIYLALSGNNTLINNTCVANAFWGIILYASWNNTIINNTCILNSYDGIDLASSSDNTLGKNNCSSNRDDGISLNWSSSNNEISWNQVSNNGGCGVNISYGSNNRIWNNIIIGNNGAIDTYNASHTQAHDDGTNNWWNSTDGYDNQGNYWSDWKTPDTVPPLGIVDHPYNISGSADAKDYNPLSYNPLYPHVVSIPL